MIPAEWSVAIAVFAGLFFSLMIHEIAHAATALYFGDDTGKRLDRLSLNPFVHVDPMMTVIVPIICLVLSQGTQAFGGARPVPVNTANLRHPRRDMMWIALAGPVSNVFLAIGFAAVFGLLVRYQFLRPDFFALLMIVTIRLVYINLLLAMFNMLPVPPLDGSKVLAAFLPADLADALTGSMSQSFLLVAILVFSNSLSVLDGPLAKATTFLLDFFQYA